MEEKWEKKEKGRKERWVYEKEGREEEPSEREAGIAPSLTCASSDKRNWDFGKGFKRRTQEEPRNNSDVLNPLK